jgi:hypothetical protein
MSDWFITPAIENAVLVLGTIPADTNSIEPDEEQDFAPRPDWPGTRQLLLELQTGQRVTPYLFFDPPDAEDAMDGCLADYPEEARETLAVAAQPFGPLSARFSGCFRRIFSRNETRRAVAVISGEPYAHPAAIEMALTALAERCDLVLGLTPDSRVTLIGSTRFLPGLLDHLPLGESTPGTLSPGVNELLNRARERGLTHEILDLFLADQPSMIHKGEPV